MCQLYAKSRCSLEDLPEVMDDKNRWMIRTDDKKESMNNVLSARLDYDEDHNLCVYLYIYIYIIIKKIINLSVFTCIFSQLN